MRNGAVQAIGSSAVIPSIVQAATDDKVVDAISFFDEINSNPAQGEDVTRSAVNRLWKNLVGGPEMQEFGFNLVPYEKRADFLKQNGYANEITALEKYMSGDNEGRESITTALKTPVMERKAAQWGQEIIKDWSGEVTEQSWGNDVAGAVGNLLVASAVSVVGSPAATAEMGFAQNYISQYDDALSHGASEEDARRAGSTAGATGALTEAIPVGRFLNKVDKATGGVVEDITQKWVTKKLSQVGKKGLEAGTEALWEGTAEAMQGVITDMIAADIVAYDPDREVFTFENIKDKVAEEGSVGFAASAFMNAIGLSLARRHNKTRDGHPAQQIDAINQEILTDVQNIESSAQTEINAAEAARVENLREGRDQKVAEVTAAGEALGLPVTPDMTEDTSRGRLGSANTNTLVGEIGLLGDSIKQSVDTRKFEQATKVSDKALEIANEQVFDPTDTRRASEKATGLSETIKAVRETEDTRIDALYESAKEAGEAFMPANSLDGVVDRALDASDLNMDTLDSPQTDKTVRDVMIDLMGLENETTVNDPSSTESAGLAVAAEPRPATLTELRGMLKRLGTVARTGDNNARREAGSIAGVLSDLIGTHEADMGGDPDAVTAWQTANDAYRAQAVKYGGKRTENILVALTDPVRGDDVSDAKVLQSFLGAETPGAISKDAQQHMDQLKAAFPEGSEEHVIYRQAQDILSQRVSEGLLNTKSNKGFTPKTFIERFESLKRDNEKTLRDHLPANGMQKWDHLNTYALAIHEAQVARDTAKLDDLPLSWVERNILTQNPGKETMGTLALAPKVAVGRGIGSVVLQWIHRRGNRATQLNAVEDAIRVTPTKPHGDVELQNKLIIDAIKNDEGIYSTRQKGDKDTKIKGLRKRGIEALSDRLKGEQSRTQDENGLNG